MDPSIEAELKDLVEETRRHLTWQLDAGVRDIAMPARAPAPPTARAVSAVPAGPPVAAPVIEAEPPPMPAGSLLEQVRAKAARAAPAAAKSGSPAPATPVKGGTLEEIRAELGDCRRCKLCSGRNSLVFGAGSPKARLVFVGEGPGEEEDKQGIPFVGAAGQLLTKMIEAMGLSRDEVYICNVVKCRPPLNRNPEPEEIAACEPFLKAQLAAIKPDVIVALGKFAAQTLTRSTTPITRMRGTWQTYEGIKLMPTFHPAYLLRTPGDKKLVWADLKLVMQELGLQEPAKG